MKFSWRYRETKKRFAKIAITYRVDRSLLVAIVAYNIATFGKDDADPMFRSRRLIEKLVRCELSHKGSDVQMFMDDSLNENRNESIVESARLLAVEIVDRLFPELN